MAGPVRQLTLKEAVIEGIAEEMRRDPTVFMLGQTVTEYDDIYNPGISGLVAEFGTSRLRVTGLVERFEAGAGVGAALAGARPIVDLGAGAFSTLAYDEIFAKAGLWRYTHGGNGGMTMPVVFRVFYTSYGTAGAEHNRSPLALYMHGLGLKVVVPSTPEDAKGLIKTAIRDDGPVVFMEPAPLGPVKGAVPDREYITEFGRAAVRRKGSDCTVAAVGYQVGMALDAARQLEPEGISAEVVDVRSLAPLDVDTIADSVRKTGRLVEVDEDFVRCGIGAEIGFQVQEREFDALRAPVRRVAAETPAPANPVLNAAVLPSTEKIAAAVRATCAYERTASAVVPS